MFCVYICKHVCIYVQFNKDNKQTSNANEQTSENAPSRECPETVNVATGRGFGGVAGSKFGGPDA